MPRGVRAISTGSCANAGCFAAATRSSSIWAGMSRGWCWATGFRSPGTPRQCCGDAPACVRTIGWSGAPHRATTSTPWRSIQTIRSWALAGCCSARQRRRRGGRGAAACSWKRRAAMAAPCGSICATASPVVAGRRRDARARPRCGTVSRAGQVARRRGGRVAAFRLNEVKCALERRRFPHYCCHERVSYERQANSSGGPWLKRLLTLW